MKKVIPWSEMGAVLATIFDKKAKKSAQGGPKGTKSPEKGHPKVYAKIYAEKAAKSVPKASKIFRNGCPNHCFLIQNG